jgi:hypothetical protein
VQLKQYRMASDAHQAQLSGIQKTKQYVQQDTTMLSHVDKPHIAAERLIAVSK